MLSTSEAGGPNRWPAAVFVVMAPVVFTLCMTIWQSPFPVAEAIALFEDVERAPVLRFLTPDTSYYRPLFHMTLSTVWNSGASLEARLAAIKLLHIIPIVLVVVAFVAYLRPRRLLEAAAAIVALAVLVGSPGFRDNLEIPLSYTIVGMPLAVLVWILLNRERQSWSGAAIVALTLLAIGFKEQGLVLVPVIAVAWWMGAPGVSRRVIATLAVIVAVYVTARLLWSGQWPMFEQAVGFGFREMEPPEAIDRFGGFPYGIYAYSAASTVANVLFSEPTRGVFRIVNDVMLDRAYAWEINHLLSSAALTGVILWWGISLLRGREQRWSLESRTFIALIVALLACGILSFNYSRDRLGGMAVPFYAMAAFYALRTLATRTSEARAALSASGAIALMLLSAAWQVRAVGTIESVRVFSLRAQAGWLTELPQRRQEFAERAVYLRIMNSMIDQGLDQAIPRPTRYPQRAQGALIPAP
jgi:hypothetical protein